MLTNLFVAAKMEPMQSNKASKKTSKIAEESTTSPADINAAESTSKPRSARSSKPKSETGETTSAKRHRKAQPAVPAEETQRTNETVIPVETPVVAAPVSSTDSVEFSEDQVRELAYRLWVERGQPHGSHNEDWFRAERELAVTA
jgi:Protein of unknown function (DUF2934)